MTDARTDHSMIDRLSDLMRAPAPFTPGDAPFWTEPHIAAQLLAVHLDPNTDAASRPPVIIRRSADWIAQTLGLHPGDALLDLGCGPGLYAVRRAQAGLRVTGVDFSQNSIDYAVETARRDGLEIEYRCQNYLELEDEARYTAAVLIYGDLCPLSPEQRTRLLANVHRALLPGGHFVLDVTTPRLRQRIGLKNAWHAAQSGFWMPGPHLVLEQGFAYEGDVYLDQYGIIEENGKITVYRNWFQDFTPETITAELESNGFKVESLWSDLTGVPYQPTTEWIGVVTGKV
jgi:SAM-dependent methyltransferase